MKAQMRRLVLTTLEDRITPATISGTAYIDANFNGALDPGESPLANVSISLDINGTGQLVQVTATNSAGQFSFPNVINGMHKLSGVLEGYSKATANPIMVNAFTTGTVTVNLGFAPSAVVRGFVFTDMNGNGVLDNGERLLPNYTVTLDLNSNGTKEMAVLTDINGLYHFVGVPDGNHLVSLANAKTNPGSRTISVSNRGDVSGLGFAVTPVGSLSGVVFADTNADGVQQPTESGLSGVTVMIDFYSDGSTDKTVTSDASGSFNFAGIPDGTHRVTAARSGFSNTTPAALPITFLQGSILPPPTPAPPTGPRTPGDPVEPFPQLPTSFGLAPSAIISGYVYGDTNKNGLPNLGEPELAGVTVRIDLGNDGSFDQTTTTDNFGRFAFSGVANGTHRVEVTLPGAFKAAATAKTITVANQVNVPGLAFPLQPVDPIRLIGVSTDSPSMNQVNLLRGNGQLYASFAPFASNGDTRVATGDVNGDGIDDFAVATGAGRVATVRVIDGASGKELFNIQPYGPQFFGGAYVALGDLDGDGKSDLVITPDITGGPRVRIFSGASFQQLADFFGIEDSEFRGGARAAVGDLNADGKGDLIVSAGFGGGPRIALFDGAQLGMNGGPKLIGDFFVFEEGLRNGAFVAAGDLDGDGHADLVAGAGSGGAPRISVLNGKALVQNQQVRIADFFAGGQSTDRSGVRVAVADVDGDGRADIVAGYRPVTTVVPRVAAYPAKNLLPGKMPVAAFDIEPFPGFLGSLFVG